jgi:hypothetical protein
LWIHRALQNEEIGGHIIDPASIEILHRTLLLRRTSQDLERTNSHHQKTNLKCLSRLNGAPLSADFPLCTDLIRPFSRQYNALMRLLVIGFPAHQYPNSTKVIASWLPLAAFVVATIVLFQNFDFGFRATADQRVYTYSALTSFPYDWVKMGVAAAVFEGRIGFIIVRPLLIFGGWIGDMWFYPFLCVGIFLTVFVSFYAWIQFLTGSKVALALSAMYLALLPAGLHHWLPNAYAMMFLPLAVGLLCRLTFQRLYGAPNFRLWSKGVLTVGIFAGAVSTELSLVLLMTMAATEVYAYFFIEKGTFNRIDAGYLVWQTGVVASAFASYSLYRFLNPSSYPGNQLPIDAISDQVIVTVLHLYQSMSIDSLWRAKWAALLAGQLQRIPEAVFVLFGLSIAIATSEPNKMHWRRLAMIGGIIAIGTTIPVAANHKYIDWCLRGIECTYIDARFSLIGIGLALFYVVFGLLPKHIFRICFAAFVGLVGAMTFLVNAKVRTDLRSVTAADIAAKAYVCEVGERMTSDGELIEQLIRLDKAPSPATFHAVYDDAYRVKYWERYLEHLRGSPFWRCP